MFNDACVPPKPSRISLYGCARYAKDALRSHFATSNPTFPLETYSQGSVFDPKSYDPGTILHFDLETLRRDTKSSTVAHNLPELPLRSRPTDLPANLAFGQHEGDTFDASMLGFVYWRRVCWGVVTPTIRRQNIVMYKASGLWGRSRHDGRFISPSLLSSQERPVEVGQTDHRSHTLHRTNVLRVCANGHLETARKPQRLKAFLGRIATES